MREFLHHLFVPRHSNNHRAKLIHHDSLLLILLALLLTALVGMSIQNRHPEILGATTNIAVDDLLKLTNAERHMQGLTTLTLDAQLSQAAAAKAAYMFSHNYWAHNAPDGTTPWAFIHGAGYEYVYAGENLARGFTTSQSVMEAWMASPGHRENILSQNYKDIGFAIVPGKLTGEDTVLVVEMFGSKTGVTTPLGDTTKPDTNPAPAVAGGPHAQSVTVQNGIPMGVAVKSAALFERKALQRVIALVLVGMLLAVLIFDMVYVKRAKVVRAVAHNADHIIFFTILLILLVMLGKGAIL